MGESYRDTRHDKRSLICGGTKRTQSYGGFMSSKVVEADAGIHSLAMAVAVRLIVYFLLLSHALMGCPPPSIYFCAAANLACHKLAPVRYDISYCCRDPDLSHSSPQRFFFSSPLDSTFDLSMGPGGGARTFLDSIYTERYMNLPALNPGGYVNASVSNVTAYDKVDYLLAHGSGDDNVHFANSAHLLDMFTKEHVRNYRFRMFTDRCVRSIKEEMW